MSADLPLEAEHLLIDLAIVENDIDAARTDLRRRQLEIAKPLAKELGAAPEGERAAISKALGERLAGLRRTTHRSELAALAGKVVTAERHRAQILRKLDAFPQLGESVPPIDIAVEHDGERGFVIKTGGGRVYRFSLPIVIDRGIWRADSRYERGDCVTSDGSLWVARRDDPSHEPGKGDAWRLAVTRGRNGRDAKPRT